MKINRFAYFMLTDADRQLLKAYAAPDSESAIAKGLPIQVLEQVRPFMRRLALLTGRRVRVMYRGPRYDACRSACRKADARGFSVYFR